MDLGRRDGGLFCLGRSCTVGARFDAETGVHSGYAGEVGNDVVIGAGAAFGSLVSIGDHTIVGAGTVIARGSSIADRALRHQTVAKPAVAHQHGLLACSREYAV